MNGRTLGSRATVALVRLICSLETGAEMEGGANVFESAIRAKALWSLVGLWDG